MFDLLILFNKIDPVRFCYLRSVNFVSSFSCSLYCVIDYFIYLPLLGHKNTDTTLAYLKSFKNEALDEMNRGIL